MWTLSPTINTKTLQPQLIDNYSYYGALQSKGDTNFLPVNVNFNAFRK